MVELVVQVMSKETIKPSSPTPHHLLSMPLSIFDQLPPLLYTHLLLYYSSSSSFSGDSMATRLKESLSKTLTHFYPLAGRIPPPAGKGAPHVECNDEGAEFFEARVEGDLYRVLYRPPTEEFNQLLPNNGGKLQYGDPLLAVQLNLFGCGGCILAISISHQVADAASINMFLKTWSGVASGNVNLVLPQFHSASVFPAVSQVRETSFEEGEEPTETSAVFKLFVIKPPAIEKLRSGDNSNYAREQVPTRVESISTLLWRCVSRGRPEGRRPKTMYSVNIRRKMAGKLQDSSFGNLFCVLFLGGEAVDDLCDRKSQGLLEKTLREAITNVDEEFLRRFAAQYAAHLTSKRNGETAKDADFDILKFSSWCRFQTYKTEFGWGEPVWVCGVFQKAMNMVVLTDTKDGEGVEVWLCLEMKEMERLEKDPEFLEFAAPLHEVY